VLSASEKNDSSDRYNLRSQLLARLTRLVAHLVLTVQYLYREEKTNTSIVDLLSSLDTVKMGRRDLGPVIVETSSWQSERHTVAGGATLEKQ
jgi:hypothetical protein